MEDRCLLFRGALEALGEPVCLVGEDRRIRFVSSALCDLLGLPREALEGRVCSGHLGDRLCGTPDCALDRIRRERRGFRIPRLSPPEDQRGAVDVEGVWDEDGSFLGMLQIWRTREELLRRTQEELRSQGELHRTLVEGMDALVFQLDPRGRVLYANPAATRWFAEALRGDPKQPFWRLAREADRSLLEQAFARALEGTPPPPLLWRAPTPEGERAFMTRCSVVRDPDGTVRTCILFGGDMTDRARVEEERKRVYHALQHAAHGVCITDVRGRILYVNRAFEDLYGFSQEEARGKNPRILNPGRQVYREWGIDGESYDRLFEGMWEALLDPQRGTWEGELVNRRKDGSLMWVRLYISSIRDVQGNVTAFFATPMDLTAQREQEEAARLETYRAITLTAEMRDEETGAHLVRIGAYARLLAETLGLPGKFARDLEVFAPFHDIGKVGIPDRILLAPRKLDPDEFEIMKSHALMGYNILKDKPSLALAAEIARGHHERWDGGGYPSHLKGSEIPLSARITAVTDVYDALRSRRPYKAPWDHEAVTGHIRDQSGKHFDPEVVRAFLEVHREFEEIFRIHVS